MKNRKDFDRMFKEWYVPFFYIAYHYVKDEEVCKDIVSETFESFWQHYEQVEEQSAKGYLAATVRRKCIDHLRRQDIHDNYIRYVTHLNEAYLEEDDHTEIGQRVAQIRDGMEKLTPYNRHILEQCYLHQRKYKEVAEELQVSVSAIHKNIVKALRILRNEIKNR